MGVVSREVKCRIVAPEAGYHRTGGHLVNGRLSADPRIELVEVRRIARAARTLERDAQSRVAVLLDSLFLRDPRGIESVCSRVSKPVGLLAHSLPSLIPGHPARSRRRLVEAEKRVLPLFDFIVSPSRFLAAAIERRGASPASIRIVPLAPIVDGRETGTLQARGPVAVVRILTVANWSPAKGLHHAWQALSQVGDLRWEWRIIGKPGRTRYSRQLLSSIGASPLGRRVSVVESADESRLDAEYRASDIFLLPTLMESYGLALAEAATFGIPVIATTAGAAGEVLGDGASLLAAGDHTGLAQCLRRLIEMPDAREEAATKARSRAAQLPRWPEVADALVAAVLPTTTVLPEVR